MDAEIRYRLNMAYSNDIMNTKIKFEIVENKINEELEKINKFEITKFNGKKTEYLNKFLTMCLELNYFFEKALSVTVTIDAKTYVNIEVQNMCYTQEKSENGKDEIKDIK